jgi:hypothetical protein
VAFLTPLASLVAVAVVVPLAAHALLERRARRVAQRLGLAPPPIRSRLGIPAAIAVVAGMLGIAAAQPVISGTRSRVGRSDAEVYFLLDTSRSMLAKVDYGSPNRLARAELLAESLRQSLGDVPVGLASMTDRVLPHLFPTLDAQMFATTLRNSIGIERPPPAGSEESISTDFTTIGNIAANNYFTPTTKKRLLIVFSDGESRRFDALTLSQTLRKGSVHVVFVHLWDAREHIFLTPSSTDPGYRPDPASRLEAARVAAAGNGNVVSEDTASLRAAAKGFLGSGPSTTLREQRTRVSLAPYVALVALLPLSFVFLRRNLG